MRGVAEWVGATNGVRLELVDFRQTRSIPGEEAFEGKVEYIGPMRRRAGGLARLKLDITFYERMFFPVKRSRIIHPYSDKEVFDSIASVYTLEEIVAEKLRSILQRTRPRDIYDLWFLLAQDHTLTDRDKIANAFAAKCAFKGLAYVGIEDFLEEAKLVSHKLAWESSLSLQITDLPDFDFVAVQLREAIEGLFAGRVKS